MIQQIGDTAVASLIQEVCTTPKPGLVDLASNGAHRDMTPSTFFASAAALSPYFHEVTVTGADWQRTLPELFTEIRKQGIKAEEKMFSATVGVNTHKGLIYLEGILCAAAGYAWDKYGSINEDTIFSIATEMTCSAIELDFRKIDYSCPKTHGEKLFVRYGYKGIRGEVQKGFPSIRHRALPALSHYEAEGHSKISARVQTLLILIATVDDTNVIYRSNPETLAYVKQSAYKALELGGAFTEEGLTYVRNLDKAFTAKNISPGGCADLLAVTIMMHSLRGLAEKFSAGKKEIMQVPQLSGQ
jgi:triphosphoribosyl-dephospho-CoA synthase